MYTPSPSFYAAPDHDLPDCMTEMNVTPLIDVMMVLLVMLILTVPPALHAVNLHLPHAVQSPPQPPLPAIQLVLSADGRATWNGRDLASDADLQRALHEAALQDPQPELHIQAHPKIRYGAVAQAMAQAQRMGMRKMGIKSSVTGMDPSPTR